MKVKLFLLLFTLSLSCGSDHEPRKDPEGLPCNNPLGACAQTQDVPYCTFGFKFGLSNPFFPRGPETAGPGITAEITFKFQEAGYVFSTHSEDDVVSLTISEETKSQIRAAADKWSEAANITLVEVAGNENADIIIILAEIEQGGIGYPAFNDEPCSAISGHLILSTRSFGYDKVGLHELGHVLGLGHVASNNVMNPAKFRDFNDLQPGDVAGIQSIYGAN